MLICYLQLTALERTVYMFIWLLCWTVVGVAMLGQNMKRFS